ncbi:MAG: hypothetical protein CGW95_07680 [Phenylobacterium zucineum]|nr:MAG: hypothetical protein CGW95_07680 [Phenylobacterium zucineum]
MAENKTQATAASVETYLQAIPDPERRADCEALAVMMAEATGCPPVMWGASIIGCDTYRYRYESGREGEICLVGFASRKGDIALYGMGSVLDQTERLGRCKTGKGCLYIRKLADVDVGVLSDLIAKAVADRRTGGESS